MSIPKSRKLIRGWEQLRFLKYKLPEVKEAIANNFGDNYTPHEKLWFKNLQAVRFNDVKVVIIGEQPYKNPRFNTGFAFSCPASLPRSEEPLNISHIMAEYERDTGWPRPMYPDLTPWCRQGVLFLMCRPVRFIGKRLVNRNHKYLGWEYLHREILLRLSDQRSHIVFMLWGREARFWSIKHILDKERHCILYSHAPGGPSSGYAVDDGRTRKLYDPKRKALVFTNSKPFSKCNEYLKAHGIDPIDWRLPAKSWARSKKQSLNLRSRKG